MYIAIQTAQITEADTYFVKFALAVQSSYHAHAHGLGMHPQA